MNFNINDFSGPLDLLLHMVKKHEVDIYEVDLKIIIDEYINFINQNDKNDLDKMSEYLTMASELIHLKSKILLGFDEEEEEAFEINSEEDLRTKLIEYEKFQKISDELRSLEINRQDYFTKTPENIRNYIPEDNNSNLQIDLRDLIKAFLDIKQRINYHKPLSTKITRKELSVKDKTIFIRDILSKRSKVEFSELFNDNSKEELVVTLLSILEMSKNNEVFLSQSRNFSKIIVEVKNE